MIKMTLTDDSVNFLIPGYVAWQVERCQATLFSIRTTSSPLWSPLRLEVCHRCDCTLPTGVSDTIADNQRLWLRRITTNHIFLCHSGLKFCHKWFPWAFLSAGNHQSPSLGQWSLQTLLTTMMICWRVLLPLFVQLCLSEPFKHFSDSILSLLSCTDHNAPLLQCQRGDGERGDAGVPCRPGRPPRRAQVPRQRVRWRPLRSSSRRNGAHPCCGSDGLSALHQVDGSWTGGESS